MQRAEECMNEEWRVGIKESRRHGKKIKGNKSKTKGEMKGRKNKQTKVGLKE